MNEPVATVARKKSLRGQEDKCKEEPDSKEILDHSGDIGSV